MQQEDGRLAWLSGFDVVDVDSLNFDIFVGGRHVNAVIEKERICVM